MKELTGQEGDLALAVLFRRDLGSEHGGSRCHVDREAALGVRGRGGGAAGREIRRHGETGTSGTAWSRKGKAIGSASVWLARIECSDDHEASCHDALVELIKTLRGSCSTPPLSQIQRVRSRWRQAGSSCHFLGVG